ncbi:retrovirus-related pol polyprotein from transposon TNT 1-94, partial [Tanacetum coccineum]
MDLYDPMRVESINGKKYILVIVDDYSRFRWVKFLRSKDEAPEVIIKCLKKIQVRMKATVCNVRTDNGTEFVNQTLPKADIGIFVWCAPAKKAFRIYNKRTRLIMETIHVTFDELTTMASEQFNSGPGPQVMTPGTLCLGLVPNLIPQPPYVPPTKNDLDILFQPMFDEFFNPPPSIVSPVPAIAARRPADLIGSPVSTSLEQDA